MDASRVQIQNGPAFFAHYAVDYGGLIVGIDPVAVDWAGWRIVEKMRRGKGLKPLEVEKRSPAYILTADKLKLGHADARFIEKIQL